MGGARQDGPRVLKETPPGLGERHLAPRAFEQAGAQFRLEVADLHGQRRLADVQALGRTGKAQGLGNGDEVAQVAQFHISAERINTRFRIYWTGRCTATYDLRHVPHDRRPA